MLNVITSISFIIECLRGGAFSSYKVENISDIASKLGKASDQAMAQIKALHAVRILVR